MNGNPPSSPSITRILVRPLGSTLPLGFFAFSVGTVLLSAVELRWVSPSETAVLAAMLLVYVTPLEAVACIFAFLARDSGSATAMGVLGAGWVALAVSFLIAGLNAKTATLGIFLVMDALAVLAIGVVSISPKPLLGILLLLAGVRFLLEAIVQFGGGPEWNLPAGALGLLTGVVGLYGAFGFLFEDTRRKTILPMFRRGQAKQSLEGNLSKQLERLEHEAGVRQQL